MVTTNYVDNSAFKSYASIPAATTTWDALLTVITGNVYGAINSYCGRVFAGTTATSTRVFRATDFTCLDFEGNDVASSTGFSIATDSGNDGTFETSWASTDWELEPLNGLLLGRAWAYTGVRAVGGQSFPVSYANTRAGVQVTASWGWPSVPGEVVQAAYILTEDLFKLKDAPFGVAGTSEFGVLRIRENTQLKMLLKPFNRLNALL